MTTAAGGSTAQMQRAFRALLGVSPRDFVAACRQRRFRQHLRAGESVTQAVYAAGYGSSSRAYEAFRLPGVTPATFAKGGAGAAISWATTSSRAGRVMVAATTHGVCFVAIGTTVSELRETLCREFPRATIDAAPNPELRALAAAASTIAEARPLSADVPVDIRGTAFQWRVWRALTEIPAGQTRTYSEVARAIGSASAVRAVARACATNPLSLLVPCHRVVGIKGDLRGYRWGTDVKAQLLDGERRSRPPKGL
ncbi:MAG: methylated-DNA--[protein]-cysteine S-methyltransferase [Vicinamibacterales bacterium]